MIPYSNNARNPKESKEIMGNSTKTLRSPKEVSRIQRRHKAPYVIIKNQKKPKEQRYITENMKGKGDF